jgi:hypothetical protein
MRTLAGVALLSLVSSAGVMAQASTKRVDAVRIEGRAPRIDGRLDEEVWTRASPATGFIQREPQEGQPATEQTEVRFAYDEAAIYIGARMFSRDPGSIRALVARRDRSTTSEQLLVSFDTYRDRRTAYSFAVNAAGVRSDYYHPSDFENAIDASYDVVWEAASSIDDRGWTAEIRIPLGQLRFDPSRDEWGVNLVRQVPARNEASYWSLVGRSETGWSSRMGALGGLTALSSPRRVELLPYVSTDARTVTGTNPANPFQHERDASMRAGADVRAGIGANLTLNATINPDFGQVELDPAEVNLSAFETFFNERRPFFVEGANLFGGRGLFYSRRIGARPPGTPGSTFFETKDNTTILGAAKLMGRLPSKTSIGVLTALTAEERVATLDTIAGVSGKFTVAPLTGYGVATLQQEFGAAASTIAATITGVQRDLPEGSPLAMLLAERAVSGIVDTRIRWRGGKYDMSAYVGFSHIAGDSMAIRAQQLSSRRYFQRPDATHIELDPSRRSLSGTIAGINHSKLAGAHWLWDIDFWQESPGLELNDMGAIGTVDDRGMSGGIRYRESTPGKYLRNYGIGIANTHEFSFGGTPTFRQYDMGAYMTLRNFWVVQSNAAYQPAVLSDNLTRGGPLMRTRATRRINADIQNSGSSRTRWRVQAAISEDDAGGHGWSLNGSMGFRPGTRLELSIDPGINGGIVSRQFLLARGGGSAATYGGRYVFAYLDRNEVVARMRLNYAIKPDLTLESYIEPFVSSGRFYDFGELESARSGELRTYGTDGTTITRDASGYAVRDGAASFRLPDADFHVASLRSNLVLRWEWRPGSTAYVVWQQNRSDRVTQFSRANVGDLGDALTADGNKMQDEKKSPGGWTARALPCL